MSAVPLCSSEQAVRALHRAGFTPARRSAGSHQAFVKAGGGGAPSRAVIVVLAKSQIPRGTLRAILRQAGLSVDEVISYLG